MSTGSGVFTMADALAHQEKLLKDSDIDPSFSQILDFTQVTKVELGAEDVRKLAQTSVFSLNARRAILAQTDLVFGLARMFEALRDAAGEKAIQVFRNLDDALEWVLAKNRGT